MKTVVTLFVVIGLTLPGPTNDANAQNRNNVVITVDNVRDNVYMLTGAGGNIGLSVGDDGALLIDDQFADLSQRILDAVANVSDTPLRFVLNTHHHGDHVGGNANMTAAGAMIVAHDNVRKRLAAADDAAPGSLPIITFSHNATFHWNGQTTRVHHIETAHTDGDALIFFGEANVVHMGDTFFRGRYPYIDLGSGGGVDGVVAAADYVLENSNGETLIIPGHGPLSTPDDLREYRTMLVTVRDAVAEHLAEGKTLQEVLESGVSAQYDDGWGGGFVNPQRFITSVYNSLARD